MLATIVDGRIALHIFGSSQSNVAKVVHTQGVG
jgi:hypothetical protein